MTDFTPARRERSWRARLTAPIDYLTTRLFGRQGWAQFWETRFLPDWLPLLLSVGLSALMGLLASQGQWLFLAALVLAVPAAIIFLRYPFAAVMAWMLFIPYFLNEKESSAGRVMFWILHRGMILLTLLLVLLEDWLGIRRLKGKPSVKLGRAELAMAVFLGITVVNILLLARSVNRSLIEFYDQILVPFLMYWLIRLEAPKAKDWKRFLWVAAITLIAECTIGLMERFAPALVPPQWVNKNTMEARIEGTLLNVAVYTSTLLFLALLLFQYAVNSKSKPLRYILIGLFGLTLFCIFLAFSRGSWLGCLLALLGLSILYPKTTLPLIVACVLIVFLLGNTVLAAEIAWGYERLFGEDSQRSANNRVVNNHASELMIMEKPFWGWGFNNYDLYVKKFITRVGDVAATLGYGVTSHNTYLTIMAELGVIACGVYMFPVVWWLWLSLKVWRRLPAQGFDSWRLLIILWLLIGHMFVVTNFMDMIRLFPFGTTLWWMALGMIGNLVTPYVHTHDLIAPRWAGSLTTES